MKNTIKAFVATFFVFVLIYTVCACDKYDDNIRGDNSSEEALNDTAVSAGEEVISSSEETFVEENSENSDKVLHGNTQGETEDISVENDIVEEKTEYTTVDTSEEIITPGVENSEDDEADISFNPDMFENAETSASIEVIDGITYVNGILIVNKTYPLPESYAPQYDQEVLNSLNRMFSDASKAGYTLKTKSGYRSYIDQKIIYNNYVAKDGKALADTYSARPGHSEHQSGLAFDLNQLLKSFGDTPEGIWLAQNCHKYGFIIRYPKGKESITGYMYEPWHVRYLGVETATKVFESGLCLEEYLGITSEYSY